jgi:hypothetical protein
MLFAVSIINGLLPKDIFTGSKTFFDRGAFLQATPFKAGLREAI